MIKFCTLFDRNYLYKGLVMYNSIREHCSLFHLYVLCFDDITYKVLQKMHLPNVTLISMSEFEDEELLKVKHTRTISEYCWTCASSLILYVLNEYTEVSSITYLDADLMFFSSPRLVFEEITNESILITPHRYTPKYDKSAISGIYCVQFVIIKRDARGLKALKWWRERCLEWCYARFDDGKFGDQKYLDDWPERFEGVHVLKNVGAGVAPWNIQQYEITKNGDKLKIDGNELVFYHYHQFECYTNGEYDLGEYDISEQVIDLIYRPYIGALCKAREQVRKVDRDFDYGVVKKFKDWMYAFRFIIRMVLGRSHVIR